jgi:hypothetical protein
MALDLSYDRQTMDRAFARFGKADLPVGLFYFALLVGIHTRPPIVSGPRALFTDRRHTAWPFFQYVRIPARLFPVFNNIRKSDGRHTAPGERFKKAEYLVHTARNAAALRLGKYTVSHLFDAYPVAFKRDTACPYDLFDHKKILQADLITTFTDNAAAIRFN